MGSVFKYQTTPFNYKLKDIKEAISRTQRIISGTDAWTTVFMENHDQARCVSRFGDDSPQWRVRSAKMLALLNAALSGTLYIYQGQELGMINIPHDWPIEEYKDVESSNYYEMVAERCDNDASKLAEAHLAIQHLSRDNARTPMQWNSSLPNGGFTTPDATPWMKVNTYTEEINVAQQLGDKQSVMAFWRRVIEIRKSHNNILVHGDFTLIDVDNPGVFCFLKEWRGKEALIVCNFSGEEMPLPREVKGHYKLLIGNVEDRSNTLAAWEGRIYLNE